MGLSNSSVSTIVDSSLRKLVKGSGLILGSAIVGMVFAYVSRILIGRFFTPAEYGIFSLGMIIVNFATLFALLGLQEGASRQIAYYRGRGDFKQVKETVLFSVQVVVLVSIAVSIVLFLLSDIIANKIFHDAFFSKFLKIFVVSIPFSSLTYIFVAITRGFDRTKESVYFQNILNNGLFLLLLILIIVFKLPSDAIVSVFALSMVITSLVLGIYLQKQSFFLGRRFKFLFLKNLKLKPANKKLLLFSLPLLGISLLNNVNSWLGSLMLGYFKNAEAVGIYNGALPFTKLISLILGSAAFLYLPIITKLYSRNKIKEVQRIYAVLTKWMFFVTLPFFLILFLFPQTLLISSFGENYIKAGLPLQILALGFLINVFFGLDGVTLLALGETRFLMIVSLSASILGVILNGLLIPPLGIIGAAVSSVLVFLIFKLVRLAKLYFSYKIHPFSKNYLKPTFFMIFISITLYAMIKDGEISWRMLPMFFIVFSGLSFLSIFLTKSIDSEEVAMLLVLTEKIGIKSSRLKNILQKFR